MTLHERRLNVALSLASAQVAQAPPIMTANGAAGKFERDRVMRVEWVLLDEAAKAEVQVGDLVSVEAGGAPT